MLQAQVVRGQMRQVQQFQQIIYQVQVASQKQLILLLQPETYMLDSMLHGLLVIIICILMK